MIRSRPLRLSFVAGALALAAPAFAQDVQRADDPRLVTQVFDETRVYTVNGNTYEIRSGGVDGQINTDDDITLEGS